MDVVEAGSPRSPAVSHQPGPASGGPGFSPGSLTSGPVLDIVSSMERLICGPHAVAAPAVADGLALAGKRAACLPEEGPAAAGHAADAAGACVYHWVLHRGAAAPPPEAIVFAPGSAQQAVDLCLAAHLIAEAWDRPVVCLLDPQLANRIEFARLPRTELIESLLGRRRRAAAEGEAEGAVDLMRGVEEALARVSAHTGRSCRPVETIGPEDAPYALVASGADVQSARRLAERLSRAGQPALMTAPVLVQPAPAARLAEALAGRTAVFILESGRPQPHPAALVQDALAQADRAGPPCTLLPPGAEAERFSALTRHLGATETTALPAPDVEVGSPRSCRMGVLPAGEWGRRFLLHTAAQVSRLATVRVGDGIHRTSAYMALTLGPPPPSTAAEEPLDVLVAADLPMLAMSEGLDALRSGGTLILHAPAKAPDALWRSLPAALRHRMQEKDLSVRWLNPPQHPDSGGQPAQALMLLLEGALLGPKSPLPMLDIFDDPVTVLVERLRAEEHPQLEQYQDRLRAGANAVQALDIGALESARLQAPPAAASAGIRMPAAGDPMEWDLSQALKRFHATGDAGGLESTQPPGFIQVSAALSPLFEPEARWAAFPLYLPAADGHAHGPAPLLDVLHQAVDALGAHSAEAEYVRTHLPTLVRDVARELQGRDKPSQFRDVFSAARDRFLQGLRTSQSGKDAMRNHLQAVEQNLPGEGMALGLGPHTLLELYTVLLQQQRAAAIVAFDKEAARLRARLEDTLRVDRLHDPESKTSGALASTLGQAASSLLDADALAQKLPAHRGGKRLDPAHRRRIEALIHTLKQYTARPRRSVAYYLVQPPGLTEDRPTGPGLLIPHAAPFLAAIGLFDGVMDDLLPVFRAVRAARLEVAGRYQPAVHDDYLARLDAEDLTPDEMKVVPAVLVREEARRLRGAAYAAFSQWAQSGRPLHALVTHEAHLPSALDPAVDAGLGYRAVAHRDTFVLQSSLAQAPHLAGGLQRMMTAAEPAVAFVGVHQSPEDHFLSWLQAEAEHRSRTHPTFVYDVERGETWADRFDLAGNDQPDQTWPAVGVTCTGPDSAEHRLDLRFTYADFAALHPDLQHHFRVIPPAAWNDEHQVPLAAYLERPPEEAPHAVPYIWVIDQQDTLQRAGVTWSLAAACREQARQWKVLQELGGINNEYARRAGERAHEEDEQRFEVVRKDLEAAHAAEVEQVRESAAEQTIERLVAVLMDMDNLPATDPGLASVRRAVAAPPSPAAEPPPEAAPEPPPVGEEEEDEVSFGEPYIDGILCTSCDDCIKLNPRMFKYNDEKQAYIADPSAGTFAELVKAAESCPGKCIHPGAPRPGDDTVTDELLAKAAELN